MPVKCSKCGSLADKVGVETSDGGNFKDRETLDKKNQKTVYKCKDTKKIGGKKCGKRFYV